MMDMDQEAFSLCHEMECYEKVSFHYYFRKEESSQRTGQKRKEKVKLAAGRERQLHLFPVC